MWSVDEVIKLGDWVFDRFGWPLAAVAAYFGILYFIRYWRH